MIYHTLSDQAVIFADYRYQVTPARAVKSNGVKLDPKRFRAYIGGGYYELCYGGQTLNAWSAFKSYCVDYDRSKLINYTQG